jgi:hypothetical protein
MSETRAGAGGQGAPPSGGCGSRHPGPCTSRPSGRCATSCRGPPRSAQVHRRTRARVRGQRCPCRWPDGQPGRGGGVFFVAMVFSLWWWGGVEGWGTLLGVARWSSGSSYSPYSCQSCICFSFSVVNQTAARFPRRPIRSSLLRVSLTLPWPRCAIPDASGSGCIALYSTGGGYRL